MTLHRCFSGAVVHIFEEGSTKTLCKVSCGSFSVLPDATDCTCGPCLENAPELVLA